MRARARVNAVAPRGCRYIRIYCIQSPWLDRADIADIIARSRRHEYFMTRWPGPISGQLARKLSCEVIFFLDFLGDVFKSRWICRSSIHNLNFPPREVFSCLFRMIEEWHFVDVLCESCSSSSSETISEFLDAGGDGRSGGSLGTVEKCTKS